MNYLKKAVVVAGGSAVLALTTSGLASACQDSIPATPLCVTQDQHEQLEKALADAKQAVADDQATADELAAKVRKANADKNEALKDIEYRNGLIEAMKGKLPTYEAKVEAAKDEIEKQQKLYRKAKDAGDKDGMEAAHAAADTARAERDAAQEQVVHYTQGQVYAKQHITKDQAIVDQATATGKELYPKYLAAKDELAKGQQAVKDASNIPEVCDDSGDGSDTPGGGDNGSAPPQDEGSAGNNGGSGSQNGIPPVSGDLGNSGSTVPASVNASNADTYGRHALKPNNGAIPVQNASLAGGDHAKDLAYTGVSDALPWEIGGGVGALLIGGAALGYASYRGRKAASWQ